MQARAGRECPALAAVERAKKSTRLLFGSRVLEVVSGARDQLSKPADLVLKLLDFLFESGPLAREGPPGFVLAEKVVQVVVAGLIAAVLRNSDSCGRFAVERNSRGCCRLVPIDSLPAIPDCRSSSAEQTEPRLNPWPDGRDLNRRAAETHDLAYRGNLRQRQTTGRDDDTVPDQLVRANNRPQSLHRASLQPRLCCGAAIGTPCAARRTPAALLSRKPRLPRSRRRPYSRSGDSIGSWPVLPSFASSTASLEARCQTLSVWQRESSKSLRRASAPSNSCRERAASSTSTSTTI